MSIIKKLLLSALVVIGSGLATGCGTTAKFVYPAESWQLVKISDQPIYEKRVAVVPFDDLRGNENQMGPFFLYLVPLMPYGWITYDRPDTARYFNSIDEFEFDISEDLAKATAYSLRRSGLFEDVFFTFGGDKDKADLLVEGNVLSTTYKGRTFSYGLSAFGPLLWIFGLPAGTSENILVLHMTITDLSSDRVLWDQEYYREKKITRGLYYRFGHDARGYAYLMQDIMNDAVEDINDSLRRQGIE